MKRKIQISIVIIIAVILFVVSLPIKIVRIQQIKEVDNWNNGYCIYDNTRLDYIGVGNKYHYKCPHCKRDYTFNELQKYKESE